jgi:cation transport regulator ChaC
MHDRPRCVFGYGSLVWRPAFPHVERRPACLHGWARRFWQGSPDHRGARGRSGSNLDYALQMAAARRALQVDDAHVFAVAELLAES